MQTVITSFEVRFSSNRNADAIIVDISNATGDADARLWLDANSITLALESARVARQFAIDARDAGLAFAARQLKGRTIDFHQKENGYFAVDSIGAIAASPAEPAKPVPAKPATRSSSRKTSSNQQ